MNSQNCRMRAGTVWTLAAGLTALAAIGTASAVSAQTATLGPAPSGSASSGPARVTGGVPASGEPGLPAATPMTDLLTRMDALETQIARLTAQNEELANRQRQIEAKLGAVAEPTAPPTMGPTLGAGTPAPVLAPAPVAAATPALVPSPPKSATAGNLSAMTGGASEHANGEHPAGPAHPSAERIAAVKAVIKPQSGDAGLDDYTYGFRLYTAKLYPEAAQQLKLYIDKYPRDLQISHARNLLGRAYLDDGKPRDAAPWFLLNYKSDPHGARAADSLLNLAAAMRQLGDDSRACIALNEFAAAYAAEAQGRLRQDYAKTRGGLTCS